MNKLPQQLQHCRFIKTSNNKKPIEREWNTKNNYDYLEFKEHLAQFITYGVLCGTESKILVVDCDKQNVEDILLKIPIFQRTFTVRTAKKGLCHFYFTSNCYDSFKCFAPDKSTMLDLQGNGKMVIGAGSRIEGKTYDVVNDKPIQYIDYQELKNILKQFDCSKLETQPEKAIVTDYKRSNDSIKDSIRQKVSIADILNKHGISTKNNPTKCPLHSSIGKRDFGYTKEYFHCFGCEARGDIFTLHMRLCGCDFITAKEELAKW